MRELEKLRQQEVRGGRGPAGPEGGGALRDPGGGTRGGGPGATPCGGQPRTHWLPWQQQAATALPTS